MADILHVDDLSVQYSTGKNSNILALNHVNFEIPTSRFTMGLVGESGSGKTTIGLSMMNLIEPPGKIVSGRIDYLGHNVIEM